MGGSSFHDWLIDSAYVRAEDGKRISGRRRKGQHYHVTKGNLAGANEEAAMAMAHLSSSAGRRKTRRWANDRLLRELAGPLDASDICSLYAPPPWGMKTEAPVLERITEVMSTESPEAVAWKMFSSVSLDMDAQEKALQRFVPQKTEGAALRAWRKVDKNARDALKRCHRWPLVSILEEILVLLLHVTDGIEDDVSFRERLSMLSRNLLDGEEEIGVEFVRVDGKMVVRMYSDSSFHRLLLHGLSQFLGLDAASMILPETKEELEEVLKVGSGGCTDGVVSAALGSRPVSRHCVVVTHSRKSSAPEVRLHQILSGRETATL